EHDEVHQAELRAEIKERLRRRRERQGAELATLLATYLDAVCADSKHLASDANRRDVDLPVVRNDATPDSSRRMVRSGSAAVVEQQRRRGLDPLVQGCVPVDVHAVEQPSVLATLEVPLRDAGREVPDLPDAACRFIDDPADGDAEGAFG